MTSDTDQPQTRRGVLLTTNLLFSTMVTGTASALGQEVAVAADVAEAVELCHARPSAYVIIDLGMAEIEIGPAVARIREAAGPSRRSPLGRTLTRPVSTRLAPPAVSKCCRGAGSAPSFRFC